MRYRIDWRTTFIATCVVVLLSLVINLLLAALAVPVLILPVVLIAGGIVASLTSTPIRRSRMRRLLQDQQELAKSFVRVLLDEDDDTAK